MLHGVFYNCLALLCVVVDCLVLWVFVVLPCWLWGITVGWGGCGAVLVCRWSKNGGPKTVKNGPWVWAFCKIEFPGIQKPVQILTQKSGFFRNPGNRGVGVIWLVWRGGVYFGRLGGFVFYFCCGWGTWAYLCLGLCLCLSVVLVLCVGVDDFCFCLAV